MIYFNSRVIGMGDRTFLNVKPNITIKELKSIVKEAFSKGKDFEKRIFEKYNKNFEKMKIVLIHQNKELEETVGKDGTLVEFCEKTLSKKEVSSMKRILEEKKPYAADEIHVVLLEKI